MISTQKQLTEDFVETVDYKLDELKEERDKLLEKMKGEKVELKSYANMKLAKKVEKLEAIISSVEKREEDLKDFLEQTGTVFERWKSWPAATLALKTDTFENIFNWWSV